PGTTSSTANSKTNSAASSRGNRNGGPFEAAVLLSVCNFLNQNLALSPDAAAFCNAALLTDLGPVLHLGLQDFAWKLADA
ncbi:MAG: hypothetical protein WA192_17940, partial [Candidatus Acidiferrales bacterium]